MPCEISITEVVGTPAPTGSITSSIRVSGTIAGDCAVLEPNPQHAISGRGDVGVIIYCGGGGTAGGYALSEGDGDVRTWSIDINHGCVCGEQISVTAVCATNPDECADTVTGPLQCEAVEACPEIVDITVDVAEECSHGRRRVTFTAQIVGTPPPRYRWEFGVPGVAAVETTTPTVSFDYPAPGDGMISFTVTLATVGPNLCIDTHTRMFSIAACDASCPVIEEIAVTPGDCLRPELTNRSVALEARVSGGGATEYEWSFGDGTPNETRADPSISHVYRAGLSYTVGLTMRGPDGCPDQTATREVMVDSCIVARDDEDNFSCAALLVISILFMSAGWGLLIPGVCASLVYLAVVGGVLLAFGLILFILWAIICARTTSCALMQRVFCYINTLILAGVILGIILGLTGDWTCGLLTIASSGYWAVLNNWILGPIMSRKGCDPNWCGIAG